jgi:glycine cleavage system H protein
MTTRYTEDHEYLRLDGTTGTVGITAYAQDQLGDIVFVELPAVGKKLKKGDEAAVVESVKAASEIYAPVSGTVIAVNTALSGDPALASSTPCSTTPPTPRSPNNPSSVASRHLLPEGKKERRRRRGSFTPLPLWERVPAGG